MKVRNKVFVITGAGGGVGSALVGQLLSSEASVAAVDVNENALLGLTARSGPHSARLSTHKVDVTNRSDIERLVVDVLAFHHRIDGLINNAGIIHPFLPLIELDNALVDRVININLFGTINVTKAFLPHLISRKEAHIVNVSSLGGLFAFANQSIYGVSKAGVRLFTEGLYTELRGTNVGVSAVIPGAIRTDITKNSGVENEKLEKLKELFLVTSPQKAAHIIISCIEKNSFRKYIGIDANILGFVNKINSKLAIWIMYKILKFAS